MNWFTPESNAAITGHQSQGVKTVIRQRSGPGSVLSTLKKEKEKKMPPADHGCTDHLRRPWQPHRGGWYFGSVTLWMPMVSIQFFALSPALPMQICLINAGYLLWLC